MKRPAALSPLKPDRQEWSGIGDKLLEIVRENCKIVSTASCRQNVRRLLLIELLIRRVCINSAVLSNSNSLLLYCCRTLLILYTYHYIVVIRWQQHTNTDRRRSDGKYPKTMKQQIPALEVGVGAGRSKLFERPQKQKQKPAKQNCLEKNLRSTRSHSGTLMLQQNQQLCWCSLRFLSVHK